jgi:hypothetical protein
MTNGELVRARKDCRLCVEGGSSRLLNGSSFDSDPEVVSHWSQWLGHQRPRLLVVGQDFSGTDYFERNLAGTTRRARRTSGCATSSPRRASRSGSPRPATPRHPSTKPTRFSA